MTILRNRGAASFRNAGAASLGTSTLTRLSASPAPEPTKQERAVTVRASVKPGYIVCLEDGKKLKMLKRYLRTNYDMSPDEYRHKWGLPNDYPVVAPNYTKKRRALAHSIGLGRKPAAQAQPADKAEALPTEKLAQAEFPAAEKPRRGRPPKSEPTAPAKAPARKAASRKLKGTEALAKVRGETEQALHGWGGVGQRPPFPVYAVRVRRNSRGGPVSPPRCRSRRTRRKPRAPCRPIRRLPNRPTR